MASKGTLEGVKYTNDNKNQVGWYCDWDSEQVTENEWGQPLFGVTKVNFRVYKRITLGSGTAYGSSSYNTSLDLVIEGLNGRGYVYNMYFAFEDSVYKDQNNKQILPDKGTFKNDYVYGYALSLSTGYHYYNNAYNNVSFFGKNGAEVLLGRGYFYIQHLNDGDAAFWIRMGTKIVQGYDNGVPSTTSAEYTLNSNLPRTDPSSPEIVSKDSLLPIKITEDFELTWEKGVDGINNPISGYSLVVGRVDYDEVLSGELYFDEADRIIDIRLGVDARSYSFSLGDLQEEMEGASISEGSWLGIALCAIGAETSLSGWPSMRFYYINKKPGAPIVSKTTNTPIPTIGGTARFSGTPGSDWEYDEYGPLQNENTLYHPTYFQEFVFPAPTLVYKDKNDKMIPVTDPSNFSLEVAAGASNATVEFYTWDGTDYSPATTVTLTRNKKPQVTLKSTPVLLDAIRKNSSYNYAVKADLKASLTANTGYSAGTNCYDFGIIYSTNSSFSNATRTAFFEGVDFSAVTIEDVRKKINEFSNTTSGVYYKFYTRRNDSLEWSDYYDESRIYFIPPKPSILSICNQPGGVNVGATTSNPEGTLPGKFSTVISITLDYDEGYDETDLVLAQADGEPVTLTGRLVKSKPTSATPNTMLIVLENIPMTQELPGGKEYNFTTRLKGNGTYYYTANAGTLTRVKTFGSPELRNDYNSLSNACPIYTTDAQFNFIVRLQDGTGASISLDSLTEYGISNFANSCSLIFRQGNNEYVLPITDINSFTFINTGSGNFYQYTFTNLNGLFNLLPSDLNRDGIEKFDVAFAVQDEFENKIKIFSNTGFYISFLVEPSFYGSQKITISKSGSNTQVTLLENRVLKEGMRVNYYGQISSYNSAPQGQLLIKRGTDTDWSNFGVAFTYQPVSATAQPGRKSPVIYAPPSNASVFIKQIEAITKKDYSVTFGIRVTTAGGVIENTIVEKLTAKEHQPGTLRLNNATFHPNQKSIEFSYIIVNPGCSLYWTSKSGEELTVDAKITTRNLNNVTASYSFVALEGTASGINAYCKQSEVITNSTTQYSSVIRRQIVFNTVCGDPVLYIKPQIDITHEYTISDGTNSLTFSTQKTTTIETEMAVYNSAPTVCYRQNYLGINTNAMENDSVNDALLVVSMANGQRTKIRFVAPDGTLKSWIDVDTGKMDGMIIEGGEW